MVAPMQFQAPSGAESSKTSRVQEPVTLLSLPPDILCRNIRAVDLKDKCRLQAVCRVFLEYLKGIDAAAWGSTNRMQLQHTQCLKSHDHSAES